MKLEDQVCSLEYAKRLKELGVKQESVFSWAKHEDIFELTSSAMTKLMVKRPISVQRYTADEVYAAFTVAELFKLLPYRITLKENEPYNSFKVRMEKGVWFKDSSTLILTDFYSVNYYCDTTSQDMDWIFVALTNNKVDENPANALAKMFIHLLENGLIKNE